MKLTLTLLIAPLLAPLAAFAQAKPEVANATTAAKPAWESAPAEKKAIWLQHRGALKHIDLSEDTQRQIVIARGSPKPGEYHAASNDGDVGGQQDDVLRLEHRPRRTRGADGSQR
jgi:hypothetical protein